MARAAHIPIFAGDRVALSTSRVMVVIDPTLRVATMGMIVGAAADLDVLLALVRVLVLDIRLCGSEMVGWFILWYYRIVLSPVGIDNPILENPPLSITKVTKPSYPKIFKTVYYTRG
jgi:hypothetical protein